MKLKKFKEMPSPNGYVKRHAKYHTIYIQSPKTGEMQGRKEVKGVGDKTGVLRVKKDFVLVKKSKRARGHTRKVYRAGEIVGRY